MFEENFLTPSQIAKQLQITERTVYRWLDAGEIRGVKLGRVWRIKEVDFEQFLKQRENTGTDKEE